MECPKKFNDQIDDLFFLHNRKVRMEQTGELIHYQGGMSSYSAAANRSYWQDNASPDHLYIATWNDKADWKKLHYSIYCESQKIINMVTPIMEKYVKDIENYHNNT